MAIVAGVVVLVLGLILVEATIGDLHATVEVSRSAIRGVGDTIDLLDDAAGQFDQSLEAAASSAQSASETTATASASLEGVADLLEEDLPAQLEAILRSMPAAIQAAGAVDGTLRALSLLGVDYNPEEPFDRSLRRVQEALDDLPSQLRDQAGSIRDLAPQTAALSDDVGRLGLALGGLRNELGSLQGLTASYRATVEQAEKAVDGTAASLAGTRWILNAVLIVVALAAGAIGAALITIARIPALRVESNGVDPDQ
jgi:ABC-type transporter Mla subunit MlaD